MVGSLKTFQRRILRWFGRCQRQLPWRSRPRQEIPVDPYHVLVSEIMLQQTQVATVVPYFHRFIEAFPTVRDLAQAPRQQVLRLWQGLGYYCRARNLHAAAQEIVSRFAGRVPSEVDDLLTLAGIGPYTAGAVASIAFGRRAAILDGNVSRVLCRLDAVRNDPRDVKTRADLWRRAEQILPLRHVGAFNSALMELGALVCTPRAPQCGACPVAGNCEAHRRGLAATIPPPRKRAPIPVLHRRVYCVRRGRRWLIERRPDHGRWAGMWQFPTREAPQFATAPVPTSNQNERFVPTERLGSIQHQLTHRRYQFEIVLAGAAGGVSAGTGRRKWVTLDQLDLYPLPRPHVRVAQMLARYMRANVSTAPLQQAPATTAATEATC